MSKIENKEDEEEVENEENRVENEEENVENKKILKQQLKAMHFCFGKRQLSEFNLFY